MRGLSELTTRKAFSAEYSISISFFNISMDT